jgi:hypothetical protein
MTLFITYDNEALQDGLGAQALRITGIYAMAKAFGLHYIHSPIIAAIEDVSHGMGDGPTNQQLIRFFNTFFNFPSAKKKPTAAQTIEIRSLSLRHLIPIYLKHRFSRRNVLLKVLLPMPILDKLPVLYSISASKLHGINKTLLKNHNSPCLVAHVRRGYDEKYANTKYTTGRHLPFSYFSDALAISVKRFRIPPHSTLVLHTDLLAKTSVWRPNQEGVIEGYRKNSRQQETDSIKLEGTDLSKLVSTPIGYSLDVHYCDSLIKTFLDMCTARVLLQGRSALSYLAGIVNPYQVIWPSTQTHSKLRRWHSSTDLGIELRDRMLG